MIRKGLCRHSECEGIKHLCKLGRDPGKMAREAAASNEDYRVGLFFRLPCSTREYHLVIERGSSEARLKDLNHLIDQKPECPDFQEYTDEEIAKGKEETRILMERMQKVFPLIGKLKRDHDKKWFGVVRCPVCGSDLHVTVTPFISVHGPEKHTYGYCETPGCVSWRE